MSENTREIVEVLEESETVFELHLMEAHEALCEGNLNQPISIRNLMRKLLDLAKEYGVSLDNKLFFKELCNAQICKQN